MHTPTQEKQLQLASYIYSKYEGEKSINFESFLAQVSIETILTARTVGIYVKYQLEAYKKLLKTQEGIKPLLNEDEKDIIGNDTIIDAISSLEAAELQQNLATIRINRFFLLRLCEIYAIVKELGDVDMRRLKQFHDNPYQHIG